MKAVLHWGLGLAGVLLLILSADEALRSRDDDRWLREVLLPRILDGVGEDPSSRLEALAETTTRLSGFETTQAAGYEGLYRVFKAPPADVARLGGQCGNLVRLYVVLARLAGFEARRAHLYEPRGLDREFPEAYVHAVAEVKVEDRWIVVDPLYGVVYRTRSGELAEARDLAADFDLVREQIGRRDVSGVYREFPPAPYDFDLYHYGELRRARWSKLPGGEHLRSAIAALIGDEAANQLSYPSWLERPHHVLAVGYAAVAACLLALGIARRRRASRRSRGAAADPLR